MIDPQEMYDVLEKDNWFNKTWQKLSASKTNPMIFSKPWDDVF